LLVGTGHRRKVKKNDAGMTLLEVLVSLVIIGIIIEMVLPFWLEQIHLAEAVAVKTEQDFMFLRAGQVLTSAVREGEVVTWTNDRLCVTHHDKQQIVVDSYYLADKDLDGIQDLYRERLGVPNPVASGLKKFTCAQIEGNLWLITLKAGQGAKEVSWERKIRQRI
jgi:prepilin-type N-terminal cleavage/methylation domain-containing protein